MRGRSRWRRWPIGATVALMALMALSAPTTVMADVTPVLAEASGPPLAEERVSALAEEMVASGGWSALADAFRLESPLSYLSPTRAQAILDAAAAELESRRDDEGAALAAALLRHRTTRLAYYLGLPELARERVASLGLLDDWHIVGPFENANMSGFDAGYGPEGAYDADARYDGKTGEVSWRPLQLSLRGYNKVGDAINPNRSTVTYAATTFASARGGRAVLRLGVDGAYKVWLNGELVGRAETDLGAELDRDAYGVTLKRGRNTLMIKLAGENRSERGFFVRLTDPSGQPLSLKGDASALRKGELLASARPHKRSFKVSDPASASASAARQSKDAAALSDAALIARRLRVWDPKTPWRDLAEEAVEASPDALEVLLTAAEVEPEQWRRLRLLRDAAKVASDNGWALVELAYEVTQGLGLSHTPEAQAIADRAFKAAAAQSSKARPPLLPALLQARLLNARNLHMQAVERLEPLHSVYPQSAPLLGTLRFAHDELGHRDEALTISAEQVAIRQLVESQVNLHARRLLRAGKARDALKLLDELLVHRKDALFAETTRAHARQQLGMHDEAIGGLDEALKRSPGHLSLLEAKAEVLELLKREEEALAVYEQALQIAPENRVLAERIKALRPDEASYEAAYRWGVEKLTPRAGDAAARHPGQDAYLIASQNIVHVAPSGQYSRFVQQIVHVLNDDGARAWGGYRIYYSPGFERIEVVSVKVRKPDGSVSEAYQREDYNAGQSAGNLYYLRRYAAIAVPSLEPGDVVEYTYREIEVGAQNFREGYFGDMWFFNRGVDVEHARYVAIMPAEMPFYDRRPRQLASVKVESGELTYKDRAHQTHSYEALDVPRVVDDRNQPGRSEVYDYVLISTYKTWDQVGRWWWNLIKDQLVVDAEIQSVVKEVTAGITDRRQKVTAIHNWVVRNTRYVGIEFGIHGWKPYRTTLCMRRRFGDCKDKASLIKVMLEAAGVETNLVLIRTRRLGAVAQDPPSLSIFNHAIAYVPEFDLFLDGTAEFNGSEELPFGDQGQFCLIVADGGKVTPRMTPVQTPDLNKFLRILEIDLSGPTAVVKGELRAEGNNAPYYRRTFENAEERREALARSLARSYPGAQLVDADFVEIKDLEKPVVVKFTFEDGSFVRQIGDSRVLFPAGYMLRMLDAYASQSSRDQDLMLGTPRAVTNRVRYTLGEDERFRSVPEDKSGSGDFGAYSIVCKREERSVECAVSFEFKATRVPVEDYAAFRAWLNELDQAVNQRLVIDASGEE